MKNKKDALTVRELLNGEGIDPLNYDTSEIRELSSALPKDGNIDLNNAEIMATKYLRGADLCAELLAVSVAYAQKTDTIKKKLYSQAALVNAEEYFTKKNGGKKPDKITDKMRLLYAEMDDDYIDASNKHDEAIAFSKWIGSKYESFIRIHYLCKKILERGYSHERASSWNGSVNYEEENRNTANNEPEDAEKEPENNEKWW